MASSPSSLNAQNSNKNTESGASSSPSLPPLPPNILLSPEDHFQDDDSGFQTAPSSPPPEPASPPPNSTTFPADVSESLFQISSPPPPQTITPSAPLPAALHERDALPSHHLLKIKSFSTLSKSPIEKFINDFEAGGYKWNFSIYPTGDKSKDGENYLSVYLEIVETSTLPAGWEVNALFNFFIFDHIRDKYVGPQDATVKRFHFMKTQWGVVKFIDLETFKNPCNGYLVNDTCGFGVEVFVVKTTSKAQCFSLINNPVTYRPGSIFSNVTQTTAKRYVTAFSVFGDYKWRIIFYPKGYQEEGNKINNIISIYLDVDASTLSADSKLLVHYTIGMENQKKNGKHFERSDTNTIGSIARGFREFMSETNFKDPENGFVVDDKCSISVEIEVLGIVTLE
ncbi:BTB/POZ and MATH domain-containing protein 6-like [Humulus lupulus]|uniref:BTB/POZ and MATH domain-containing protein 6-like n=1 Tax=Humulus lupulus TaxID=3486 RepID=UPI002B40586F|nr:BTB/POZ and MATH domain-containing protein 6-like [Humulus lupulus]